MLFVERRMHGQAEEKPGTLGWYTLPEIPAVVQWLDTGSADQFDLAEDIYQAFQPYIQPSQALHEVRNRVCTLT